MYATNLMNIFGNFVDGKCLKMELGGMKTITLINNLGLISSALFIGKEGGIQ